MKRVTRGNYRSAKLYPRVARAVAELLAEGAQVAPVRVFMKMGMLSKDAYETWRVGRVAYLERVVQGNLGKVSRVLRILGCHARDSRLQGVIGNYMGLGKARVVRLQFSKNGERAVEEAWRRHFIPVGGALARAADGEKREHVVEQAVGADEAR